MDERMRNAGPVYDAVLGQGRAGRDRFYEALRALGVPPTPADREGFLFAPNPVILPRSLVETMSADLERFCRARRDETVDAGLLAATMPEELRAVFAGPDISARIQQDLKTSHPYACLDCFCTEDGQALRPAYLEWQTFPAYPATAVFCLQAIRESYPGVEEAGARFSPIIGESLDDLTERVRRMLVRGVEEDPRQGVLVDFEPATQETSFEFDLQVRLTGGEHGLGVIDPREVFYVGRQPHYRRQGQKIPIRSVTSRLVHGDLAERLLPALSRDERQTVSQFFNDVRIPQWNVHPLHFLYGTKGDLPRFRDMGLSDYIPACEVVTPELIEGLKNSGHDVVAGRVQKPVEGHGGRDVIENPRLEDLEPGSLLQETIQPTAHHPTLDGPMTPEIRVMALPDADGGLTCGAVFTRVKSPDAFRSNAGAIAARGIPGTGEGYALIVEG